jgi:hypothetical protein
LKILEDKIFIFLRTLRENGIYLVCEIISSQSVLLLKRRQFQTLQSTFALPFLLWCLEFKKMGHAELTTTSSCSSYVPLCLQRDQLDITLKVFRTGVGISFFPGCRT